MPNWLVVVFKRQKVALLKVERRPGLNGADYDQAPAQNSAIESDANGTC